MILLILFAFLAGIVTILSPCILPILPIVLSGSLGGGKRRPLGVVTGFILSFTFFTLFLSALVKATGVSADIVRTFSVIIIAIFGLTLVLPQAQAVIERLFTKLSSLVPNQQQQSGFLGGIFIGVSLGLLWTPCVGPILASVISLALTGSVSGSAIIITLSYAVGTALPMLIITYTGRTLLQKNPWLLSNSTRIQKGFGIIMIITAIGIFFNIDRKFQTIILEKFPQYGVGLTKFENNQTVQKELQKVNRKPIIEGSGKPMLDVIVDQTTNAPEFIPGGEWFNSPPLTMKELRGKVVLVDFWTYTCINCIRTLPYIKAWHEKYKDKGLVIVGVHTPEFEFEKDAKNVAKAIKDFDLKYPIVQDNDYATWNAYSNHYWPAKYFVDKNGKIRYTHFGEGDYDQSEEWIKRLLAETGSQVSDIKVENPTYQVQTRTPELYLGNWRIEYFASPERIQQDKDQTYSIPDKLSPSYFAYGGSWNVGYQRAMPHKDAKLTLNFESKEVFLVMRTKEQSGRVRVSLDGNVVDQGSAGEDVKNGIVTVDSDRLYKLIKLSTPGRHVLTLEFLDSNLELYAFTFG